MKKLILLSLLFFTFSCATTKKTNESNEIITPIVGGDQDEHGCKASAGYTWSSIKNECIRVFELENQLVSIDKTNIIAFILSSDETSAEVFTDKGVFLLNIQSKNSFETQGLKEDVFLKLENGNWIFGTISNNLTTHISQTKAVELLGNDKDEHGCIGSAGYTWSSIKNECIRVFELPLQLKTLDETSIIGVTFSENMKIAEVFTANGTFKLNLKHENYYENASENIVLKKQNDNWVYGTISDKKISHKQYVTH
jgi:hypothetical protein